ncbi:TPA: hypothetical protein ACQUIL_001174 [Bacillus tropicus]
MNTYKSIKKVMLVGITATALLSGCGNDSIKNTESNTKDNAKQVTNTDAQKNDELKEKVTSDAHKVVKEEKNKETNDNTPYYKETNDDGIPVYMEEYDKIEVGISANKVKELIGEPSDIEKYKSYSLYRYGGWDSKGEMTVYFDKNGTVTKKEQNGLRYQPDKFERDYGVKRKDVQIANEEPTEDDTKKYEEKNDRMPWYKDVNNDSAEVDYDDYLKIKKGMSANQVKEAIGKPRMIEKYKSYSVYGYLGHGDKGSLRIIFDPNGTVTKIEENGLRHQSDDDSPYNTDVNQQSHPVSLDMFESIKIGMTADEVTEIVGTSPRTIEDYKKEVVFNYVGNGTGTESYMLLTFDLNYKLIKKDAKGLV